MEKVNQGLSGYRIPAYIEEILTHNYCPYFMKMSIVREGENYKFVYRPGNLERLKANKLDTYSKLMLLKDIENIFSYTSNYLITPDTYLLEPELIYTRHNDITSGPLTLMFYPDVRGLDAQHKLMLFAERIKNNTIREERELFEQFHQTLENGDINRAGMFLDKHILRYEGRMLGMAG